MAATAEDVKTGEVSNDAQKQELTRNVNNIVRRCKTDEFGVFSYLCLRCHFSCTGRKQLVKHLESEHSSVLLKFSESFQNKESFQTLLNKLVMIAPFVKKILKSSDSHVNPKESTNGSTETAKNQPSKPQIKQPNSNQSNPTLKRKSELASENASPTKKTSKSGCGFEDFRG